MQGVDLKKRVWQAFQRLPRELQRLPILLAVSAGRDSNVLAAVALELRDRLPPLHWVHVNYHLRVPDSDREEKSLRRWAREQEVPLFVKRLFPKKKPANLQAWAREQRLRFFFDIQKKMKSSRALIWVAHHQQDQAETILERMLRGAGVRGIGGMENLETLTRLEEFELKPALNLFRPFLEVPTESIAVYAGFHRVAFHQDRSNFTDLYLRNRLRRRVLPLLARENPQVVAALCHLGKGAQEAHQALRALASHWLKKNLKQGRNGPQIPRRKLQILPWGMACIVLEEFLNLGNGPASAVQKILPRLRILLENSTQQLRIPLKRGRQLTANPKFFIINK